MYCSPVDTNFLIKRLKKVYMYNPDKYLLKVAEILFVCQQITFCSFVGTQLCLYFRYQLISKIQNKIGTELQIAHVPSKESFIVKCSMYVFKIKSYKKSVENKMKGFLVAIPIFLLYDTITDSYIQTLPVCIKHKVIM